MSAENVDLVQRGYAHYVRTGDIFEPGLHPDIEWHSRADLLDSDVYRRIDAVRAFIQGWPSGFDDFGADIEGVIDRGSYAVVSLVLRGRLTASGQAVTMPETHVWKIRDGKVIEAREYDTTEAALEAIPDNEP